MAQEQQFSDQELLDFNRGGGDITALSAEDVGRLIALRSQSRIRPTGQEPSFPDPVAPGAPNPNLPGLMGDTRIGPPPPSMMEQVLDFVTRAVQGELTEEEINQSIEVLGGTATAVTSMFGPASLPLRVGLVMLMGGGTAALTGNEPLPRALLEGGLEVGGAGIGAFLARRGINQAMRSGSIRNPTLADEGVESFLRERQAGGVADINAPQIVQALQLRMPPGLVPGGQRSVITRQRRLGEQLGREVDNTGPLDFNLMEGATDAMQPRAGGGASLTDEAVRGIQDPAARAGARNRQFAEKAVSTSDNPHATAAGVRQQEADFIRNQRLAKGSTDPGPIPLGEGAESGVMMPQRNMFSGREVQDLKRAQQKLASGLFQAEKAGTADPITAPIGQAFRKLLAQRLDEILTNPAFSEGANPVIKDINQRLSDLNNIMDIDKLMGESAGVLFGAPGKASVRAGLGAGLGAGVAQATGQDPITGGAVGAPLAILGLSPRGATNIGFMGSRLAGAAPNAVRGTETVTRAFGDEGQDLDEILNEFAPSLLSVRRREPR